MSSSRLRAALLGLALGVVVLAAGAGIAWYAGFFGGLRSLNASDRVAAATNLAETRRDDPGVDSALVDALRHDPSESVRAVVADTLGKRGNPGVSAALAAALKDDTSPSVRAAAAEALYKIPDLNDTASEALKAATTDRDPHVRRCAFVALQQLARESKSPESPMVRQLGGLILAAARDPGATVRREGLLALRNPPAGTFSEFDAPAEAQLRALDDKDFNARTFAGMGVPPLLKSAEGKLSPATLQMLADRVSRLVELMQEGDRDTRPVYQQALVAAGRAARAQGFRAEEEAGKKGQDAIAKALTNPDPALPPLLLDALPTIAPLLGPGAEAFLAERFRAAAKDAALRPPLIRSIKTALDVPGPDGEKAGPLAVELLRPLMKDEKPMVRASASMTLWQSPNALKAGGDALRDDLRAFTRSRIEDLKSRDPETRDVAVWCLAWTDRQDADAALSAVKEALKDDEPLIQEQAQRSLAKLESAMSKPDAWPDPSWGPFRPRPGRGGGPQVAKSQSQAPPATQP